MLRSDKWVLQSGSRSFFGMRLEDQAGGRSHPDEASSFFFSLLRAFFFDSYAATAVAFRSGS
jgi:hypothetical protein